MHAGAPRRRLARAVVAASIAVGLLLMTTAFGQAGGNPELLPIDEAGRRPDFFTFRAHLQRAVARRDWPAVLAVVHSKIRNSFGPDDGLATFRETWNAESADSALWETLGAVLALGGSFDRAGNFMAPYVYSRWPGTVAGFEHVAVVGSRVRVRAAPRADAEVLAALSYAILRRQTGADSQIAPAVADDWTAVALAGGRTGFIASQYVRSPIDYRAIFAEEGGRWRLMALIAGD
jgi:hypothetical protein